MIEIDSLSVGYGDVPVLEDVDVSIDRGELVGLVGPNGAGKTTLLQATSGVLAPDTGRVEIDGHDVHALSSKASSRLVSVVPQDTHLSFSFDVRDVVEMGRTPHRSRFSPPTREDRELVDHALERTHTLEFADRSIDEVSGGERQRVLLARAIAQDTPVVLLDEPTASLDVSHAVETLEHVADLVADGKTAVAAIHDLDLAARYCDRLIVLADGAVLSCGPPEEVLTADAVGQAFDATAAVTTNPVTGTQTITALSSPVADVESPGRVHVLGRGSTAASVVARLDAAGVDVSVGPVSSDDVAAETVRTLAVDRLAVDPYTPLSGTVREELESRLEAADVTVIADLAVSAGNQLVLESLADAGSLVVVETEPFTRRNHAGTEARRRYERLRRTAVVSTPESVLGAVSRATVEEGDGRRDASLLEADDD
ncbi:ATP-binding cassette domain-containing protein [Natrialbaceae archaeon AArc-T1-2]|uniref:ATP-binding cassette domain-containing protein n=1 Tax=Natrialbaceae archaeon AArc-T1-2 TaxID=3053904 RepID=UPI00255AD349|nr:ATP-binding cassette domain-containing protein [Natrialbaceae archaeon AArc-T1-2]WIV66092.1 ATP-binding cassette domain-containing protein [Natrialbaceae archaeon AArc-T1-2]